MNIAFVKSVYFLGIGGIGMSAIARYFLSKGIKVYGYDLTPSSITDGLEAAGATIHFDENIDAIPHDIDLVVHTPAVSRTHKEYVYFQEHNIPIYKRSQVLGMITDEYPTLAVAGTHGKTTTTAMLTLVQQAEHQVLAFIGGVAKNFDSNFVLEKNSDIAVVEADEFDRSFLTLHPSIAIITSMDADHLDVYGSKKQLEESFQLFANQIRDNGFLVIHEKVADKIQHPRKIVYGTSEKADYRICNVDLGINSATFDLLHEGNLFRGISISVTGMYNVLNAAAAFIVAHLQGIDAQKIKGRLSKFNGVKRRLDYQIVTDDVVYIDDYAHHPEEIRACLSSIKLIFPQKKLTVIFQPHLFTRTRDFAHEFAEVLALADKVILLDIYPAREKPIDGVTSAWLLSLIPIKDKILLPKEELLPHLLQHRPELLVTLGAGNIDRLVPEIRAALQ